MNYIQYGRNFKYFFVASSDPVTIIANSADFMKRLHVHLGMQCCFIGVIIQLKSTNSISNLLNRGSEYFTNFIVAVINKFYSSQHSLEISAPQHVPRNLHVKVNEVRFVIEEAASRIAHHAEDRVGHAVLDGPDVAQYVAHAYASGKGRPVAYNARRTVVVDAVEVRELNAVVANDAERSFQRADVAAVEQITKHKRKHSDFCFFVNSYDNILFLALQIRRLSLPPHIV